MGELRRGDTVKGIQSSSIRIRGSVYKSLRATEGAAMIASRTSGKALRTSSNFAMNRIRSALLSGDRREALKYLTEEEVKRWDSLSAYQKSKIVRKAEKYADQVAARGTDITERPKILAGKMNKLTKEKLPYRYEVETYAGNTAPEIRNSMKAQERYIKDVMRRRDGGPSGDLNQGILPKGMQRTGMGQDDSIDQNSGIMSMGGNMAAGCKAESSRILQGSPSGWKASPSMASPDISKGIQSSRLDGGAIQSVVFYASNERKGNRKAEKIRRKYKKALAKESRQKAAAFLGAVLETVNKDSDRKERVEQQYKDRAISIDRYMSERNGNAGKTVMLPARAFVKMRIRQFGKKIRDKLAEVIAALIPPIVKQIFAGLIATIVLFSLLFFLLNVLLAGGSQAREADLGLWRLTAYCNCSECCGRWAGGPTASGVMPTAGRTVAIHSSTMEAYGLRFGDKLMIRDHIYTLEDHGGSEMGGSNGGKCVDIYVDDHGDCYNDAYNGYANVYLISEDGTLSLIGGGDAEGITAYADQFVGYPYVWGGSSLTEGCDCSHFVWLVLMNCGVYSGEYLTSGEWAYAGSPVNSLSEARAGDIVVYNGHVAIYDGAGMIIEAKGSAWGITHDRNVTCKPIVAIRRFT